MSHPHGAIPDPRLIINQMEIPGQPGVFVLGCYEHNVSILSQQIRAINLVLSLEVEGRLERYENNPTSGRKRAIIIGSGVAGKTAAAILHRCHCDVTIVGEDEKRGANPAAESQRFIHPFISEFPYSAPTNVQPNNADLPVMNWQSGTAKSVYKSLDNAWKLIRTGIPGHPCDKKQIVEETGCIKTILPGVSGYYAVMDDGRFLIGDLVILAVGKGRLPSDNNYWSADVMEKQVSATNENGGWILAGMGDSNIAEFITLVFEQTHELSAYQIFIENAATALTQDTRPGLAKLLSDCRAIERKCQHLRSGEASRKLEKEYGNLLKEHAGILDCITMKLPLKKKMPKIQIVGTLPTLYSPRAFPLNRLVLALTIKQLKAHFANRDIMHKIGRAFLETSTNPDSPDSKAPSKIQHQVVRIKNGEENDVMVCQHFNERGLPPSPLNSIQLSGKSVDDWARSDLHSKNSLDQTRHRMWPYFGNIKRLRNFRKSYSDTTAQGASHEQGHATCDGEEHNTNRLSLIKSITFRSPDGKEIDLEMCYVPGFTANAGRSNGANPEQEQAAGGVDPMRVEGFWIGRYPITVAQYSVFSDAGGESNSNFPQTNVSWIDALQFCNAFGLSLPTEIQWRASWQWPMEKGGARHFPWGNIGWNKGIVTNPDAESLFKYCNAFEKGTHPAHGVRYGVCDVKCYAHASSPWGTVQQFGNILEWCVRDGRAMRHYWLTATTDHGDQYNDPRFRPIGGLSALDLDLDAASKTWMEFGTAHHATRRPDLGFRVVWIPPMDSQESKLASAWEERNREALTKKPLPNSAERWKRIVNRLRSRKGSSGYSYQNLVTDVSNGNISKVEVVFGDWNSSEYRGLKSSGALASDAIGVDIFVDSLLKLQPSLQFSFRLASDFGDEEIVRPGAETLRVFIGSGAVNRGTAIALKVAEELSLVADVTFDGPEANRIWDHSNYTFSGSDGLVTMQRLSAKPDSVGPVIISAGIGRHGTILATKALAEIVRDRGVSERFLKLEAIFVRAKRSPTNGGKKSTKYQLKAEIKGGSSRPRKSRRSPRHKELED